MSWILAFVVYWLVLFVACYLVTEHGQANLYDEVTPYLWPKVAGGSLLLAAVLTRAHTSFDTMMTDGVGWTIGQAILWFLVFMLVLRFQPLHAAVLGVITMVLVVGLVVGIGQTLTQLHEPVIAQAPRLVVVVLAVLAATSLLLSFIGGKRGRV